MPGSPPPELETTMSTDEKKINVDEAQLGEFQELATAKAIELRHQAENLFQQSQLMDGDAKATVLQAAQETKRKADEAKQIALKLKDTAFSKLTPEQAEALLTKQQAALDKMAQGRETLSAKLSEHGVDLNDVEGKAKAYASILEGATREYALAAKAELGDMMSDAREFMNRVQEEGLDNVIQNTYQEALANTVDGSVGQAAVNFVGNTGTILAGRINDIKDGTKKIVLENSATAMKDVLETMKADIEIEDDVLEMPDPEESIARSLAPLLLMMLGKFNTYAIYYDVPLIIWCGYALYQDWGKECGGDNLLMGWVMGELCLDLFSLVLRVKVVLEQKSWKSKTAQEQKRLTQLMQDQEEAIVKNVENENTKKNQSSEGGVDFTRAASRAAVDVALHHTGAAGAAKISQAGGAAKGFLKDRTAKYQLIKQRKESGIRALITWDYITHSYYYFLLSTLTPITIIWGGLGFYVLRLKSCDLDCDQMEILIAAWIMIGQYLIFAFLYLTSLITWFFGYLLNLKGFRNWLKAVAQDLDDATGSLPILAFLLDSLVLRDPIHQSKAAKALLVSQEATCASDLTIESANVELLSASLEECDNAIKSQRELMKTKKKVKNKKAVKKNWNKLQTKSLASEAS